MYLIQGSFFQENSWLKIARHPKHGIGAVIANALVRTMFHGILCPEGFDTEMHQNCNGVIGDAYGNSLIFDLHIGEDGIGFTKIYDGRSDEISYTFTRKHDGFWIGEYKGALTGNGICSCIVTQVKETFGDPKTIAEVLKRKAFVPPSGGI